MISGLDTDSIVQAMVSAQKTKQTKIENKITLNKWTTEAWSGLNTKIYSFYTKFASKLRLQSSYMTRTAKSSNENVVTATAGSTAAIGTHSLKIINLASSQYVTGAQLKDADGKKANYNKNTKLSEMGIGNEKIAVGTVITITGKKGTDDEVVKKLEVTDSTSVNDFLTACKDAGLTANFDTTQQRFFISSSESGTENKFSITTSAFSDAGTASFKAITDMVDVNALSSADKTAYEEAMATLRQNADVIDDVFKDGFTYENADKTQKAVYDAVNKVKDITAGYIAETSAKKSESAELLSKVKTALSDSNKPELTLYADTDNKKTYTNEELVKLRDDAKAALITKSQKDAAAAGDKAVAELKEKYGDNYVTKADVDAAEAKKKAAEEEIADVDAKMADTTLSQEEKDKLTEQKTAAQAKVTEANAVITKWGNPPTDTDGNVLKDTEGNELVSLKSVYEAAYNPLDLERTENADKLEEATMAEVQKKVIADNQAAYDAVVAADKATILNDAEKAAPETAIGTEIVNKLAAIKTALEAAQSGIVTGNAGALSGMGLADIAGTDVAGGTNGMAVVSASDAEFELDGATMTETSNNFTVNGITLNLTNTTLNKDTGEYDSVQITVGKDADSTYKVVKEAIDEYNKLIEEMNKLYNADSARGYDPLTDEQKEAMTEDDIKNWEDKIKSSLLRRDDSLGSLLSSMRSALASTYKDEETGKVYSLSTYGIVTGNYTENGKLHIYGNEDDASYATYADRLKAALEEDPDQVMETLTNVFGKLYDTMTEKCAKTEISSALTFYNDKQYKNLLDDYEDDLDIMEDRIKELEDKYYKQFTAMETALSKLQSQTNSLASLLGSTGQ